MVESVYLQTHSWQVMLRNGSHYDYRRKGVDVEVEVGKPLPMFDTGMQPKLK